MVFVSMYTGTRRAIVHIGHEKTGSTSIQHALAVDRDMLRTSGFLFPKSPGNPNHTRLVTSCLDDAVCDNTKAHQMARTGLSAIDLRKKFQRQFHRELTKNESWHTLIISSELIASRLIKPSEIDRLIAMLQQYVEEIEIIVFLRRQDRLAVSRFSSVLRCGYPRFEDVFADFSNYSFREDVENRRDRQHFYDFDQLLRRFENRAGVKVRPYLFGDEAEKVDPVATFYRRLSADDLQAQHKVVRLNSAMSAKAQYVIAELNQKYSVTLPNGLRNEPYRALIRRIEAEVVGPPREAPRAEAEDYYHGFLSSNASVQARYFPQRPYLFSGGFDDYPSSIDTASILRDAAPLIAAYEKLFCNEHTPNY